MLEKFWWKLDREVGAILTTTYNDNHHFVPQSLLPFRASMQIDEYPKEFFEDEQWEWSQIFKAKVKM